jgi:ABC-type oligopeptide transport system substrate-binding subunit
MIGQNRKKSAIRITGQLTWHHLSASSNNFTPQQEQFIISLANLAALYELGNSLETLKIDLVNYETNSDLFTKLNNLNNHEYYTNGWQPAYNSETNSNDALVSPEIGDSGFQLKFYSVKNSETNALGLIKEGNMEHAKEWAFELLDGLLRNSLGIDDLIYDMHLYNALNFMDYYCND